MSAQITVTALAKMLQITPRRVQQLADQGVIPRAGRGKYDLEAAVAGYVAFIQDRTPQPSDGQIDYREEKARLTKAQADIAEIELAKARQEVAPVIEFERTTAAIMTMLQVNMLNIPQRVVTRLLGETDESKFKKVLTDEIRIALETAANTDLDLDDDNPA